jgi:hypothetical protein
VTEARWLASVDWDELWESEELWQQASARKCALYAVACARRIWHLFPDDLSRRVVETLERLADGLGAESDLEAACTNLQEGSMHEGLPEPQAMARSVAVGLCFDSGSRLATMAASYSHAAARGSATYRTSPSDRLREREADRDLMKELLSHLLRPAELPPPSLSPTVTSLAQAAYDQRTLPAGKLDPARLAVLTDALEEAGCTDAELLGHLRGPGPHVRGCWAVDLLLGKG